jgi:hypothetical protein
LRAGGVGFAPRTKWRYHPNPDIIRDISVSPTESMTKHIYKDKLKNILGDNFMSKKERIFRCEKCNTRYETHPPSDDYDRVSLEHPKAGNYREDIEVKKVIHDCDNDQCNHPIELYWYRAKIPFSVG